ncbi:hypothetical protein Aperf_G00000023886 [Anoplocephala perfoliata]
MHHLAAVAVSNSALSSAEIDVHLHDHPIQNSSVPRHIPDMRSGVGATSLILDGTPLNHDNPGNDLENSVIEFEARLSTLPKIPSSRLGKGATTLSDGDSVPSVFPPAFTVVLGGMPSYLAHRLFTSVNSSQVFSQPVNNLPLSPSAAAIIAAPVNPEISGCLFYPISETVVETDEHTQQDVQQVCRDSRSVTVVVGDDAGITEASLAISLPLSLNWPPRCDLLGFFLQVDESTAAVAGLTSEVPAVSIGHAEQYEEEIDESIQISTS